jgi:hypothetical protein
MFMRDLWGSLWTPKPTNLKPVDPLQTFGPPETPPEISSEISPKLPPKTSFYKSKTKPLMINQSASKTAIINQTASKIAIVNHFLPPQNPQSATKTPKSPPKPGQNRQKGGESARIAPW